MKNRRTKIRAKWLTLYFPKTALAWERELYLKKNEMSQILPRASGEQPVCPRKLWCAGGKEFSDEPMKKVFNCIHLHLWQRNPIDALPKKLRRLFPAKQKHKRLAEESPLKKVILKRYQLHQNNRSMPFSSKRCKLGGLHPQISITTRRIPRL